MLPTIDLVQSNLTKVSLDTIGTFYFSYTTCIAFHNSNSDGLVVDNHFYSNTTRKHQNILITTFEGHYIDHDEFVKLMESLNN